MAPLHLLGLLVLVVAVPQAYGAGCTPPFYEYGEVCLNTVVNTELSWTAANIACKALNAAASLAIVDNYRTQAHLVSIMEAYTDNVYIGLTSTTANPSFHWGDGFGQYLGEFTRWGVGQPDGYPVLTGNDYCVVMDNTNRQRPGRWYDVPCTETHKYICSMPLDPNVDISPRPPSQRCPGGDLWYGYSSSICFFLDFEAANVSSYVEASNRCSDRSSGFAHLATVTNGYESALLEGIMYGRDISNAWIGLSSTDGEFAWESGYPIMYTNWGVNEPSAQASEGCVKANIDGEDWDDTTCADKSAYFCRYDNPPLRPPATTPMPNFPCPTGWESFGSDCYLFSAGEADWGEANFRCLQDYGSSLVSITSDKEREFVYNTAASKQGGPGPDKYVWIGLTRIQTSQNEWGSFGWVDGSTFDYAYWSNGQPDGFGEDVPLPEICVTASLSAAGAGAWSDEICQFNQYRYVCKMRQASTYQDTVCPGDTNKFQISVDGNCYMPSTITGVENAQKTWKEAENFCRENYGHLVSIHSDSEQDLVRKLSFSFALSYWIGLEQPSVNVYTWSDGTSFSYNQFQSGDPDDLLGEERCGETLIWENGIWETSACGNSLPFICKRGDSDSSVIGPIPGYPDTGDCPSNYFQLGNMCYIFKGVETAGHKSWEDARNDCQNDYSTGNLATVSHAGQQALMASIIKAFAGTDLWIGLNGIGIHDQYHWTDGTPLDYTSWMEGQPDNSAPIGTPDSQPCVVMMNNPDDPGVWNDVTCSVERAYLCQVPLGSFGGSPPVLPGECSGNAYTPYFDTCLLLESTTRTFDSAMADCKSKDGNLLSVYDKYEVSFLTASLYSTGFPDDAEGWIGMKRNTVTKVFEWIDNWPVTFTRWGPNEPNDNTGDCVVMTKDGYWAVRSCTSNKYYFCEEPTGVEPPVIPGLKGGDCMDGYIAVPDTDYCIIFKTTHTAIFYEEGDYFCARDYSGRMVSVHSLAEENFIKTEAKKVITGSNAQVWLGVERNEDGFNTWVDLSLMDYVNWVTGEPSTEEAGSPGCVTLNLDGGWADVGCGQRTNLICKAPKIPRQPTEPPEDNSSTQLAIGLSLPILLCIAAILMARR